MYLLVGLLGYIRIYRQKNHEMGGTGLNDIGMGEWCTDYDDIIVERDYTDNPNEFKPNTIWSYSSAINRNRKILSFYAAYINFRKRMVSDFCDNMAEEFGEYGILILDRLAFFERVSEALKKISNCREAKMGFMEYQKMGEDSMSGILLGKISMSLDIRMNLG